jgi:hypothetical protein
VRGLDFDKNVKVYQLFNLFGCFGNIIIISVISKKKMCLIEFQNEEHA